MKKSEYGNTYRLFHRLMSSKKLYVIQDIDRDERRYSLRPYYSYYGMNIIIPIHGLSSELRYLYTLFFVNEDYSTFHIDFTVKKSLGAYVFPAPPMQESYSSALPMISDFFYDLCILEVVNICDHPNRYRESQFEIYEKEVKKLHKYKNIKEESYLHLRETTLERLEEYEIKVGYLNSPDRY